MTPQALHKSTDDSVDLKKNLGGGHKFSEFACLLLQNATIAMVDDDAIYLFI